MKSYLYLPVLLILSVALLSSCSKTYKPEERLTEFKNFAATLPLSQTTSITKLKEKFDTLYADADQSESDDAFFILNEFMEMSIEDIYMANTSLFDNPAIFKYVENFADDSTPEIPSGDTVRVFAEQAIQNGYRFYMAEGSVYLDKAVNFPGEFVLDKLSPSLSEYLSQLSRERSEGFAEDGGLNISPDAIADRLVWYENYLARFPDSRMKTICEESIHFYLGVLQNGLDNSPAFDNSSKTLLPEFREAYIRILAKYPDSPTIKKLSIFFDSVKANNYKLPKE